MRYVHHIGYAQLLVDGHKQEAEHGGRGESLAAASTSGI